LQLDDIAFPIRGIGERQEADAGHFMGDDLSKWKAAMLLHDVHCRCYILDFECDVPEALAIGGGRGFLLVA
jgi:hypothetical protein